MDRPVLELVRRRFSCRTYLPKPVSEELRSKLKERLARLSAGPFGGRVRLILVAASDDDATVLKGLGTYGTIRNPQGFLVGVMGPEERNLEDFGYLMERAVLEATDIGLGTCWLGGLFRRSRFAAKVGLAVEETIPAVVSAGICADSAKSGGLFGLVSGRASRLPVEDLFFLGTFDRALPLGDAGIFSSALEAVRWAPSASNKQPWRIVRQGGRWHFYLRRTMGYNTRMLSRLFGQADLQRVDMGIAMCHFELAAREAGASGTWEIADPGIFLPDALTSYTATWREAARPAISQV
jgi:nitroreductase